MSVHLPTLKQLQYLVALHTHGHFGRAAEACFVTQSTLSAGIKELETLIGVTLVERTRRVVRFSPLGLRVAEKARRILRETEDLADMVRASGKPLAGELRLGVIPTVAPFLLPRALPGLRDRYPALRLFIREDLTPRLIAALKAAGASPNYTEYPGVGHNSWSETYKNPEFYAFYRSLEAYRNSFKGRSDVIVVEPNSDFFKYMKSVGRGEKVER